MSSAVSDELNTSKEHLEHLQTTATSIPQEKSYLKSGSADGRLELTTAGAGVEHDWRKKLGNPAPM